MDAALAIIIAFSLSAQCRSLGNIWAFVITILLWSFLDLDTFGLGIIASFVTLSLFLQNYNQTDEKES